MQVTTNTKQKLSPDKLKAMALDIKEWGASLGFQAVGIADIDLDSHEKLLERWLASGFHGDMHYMSRHGTKRSRPAELVPGTLRVISARMNYLENAPPPIEILQDSSAAYISRYALGRDYHKVLRARLRKLVSKIRQVVQSANGRVFVDSAPVLEKALGQKAGVGWIGKHTNLIHRDAGSWFFLGEIFINLPLPVDKESTQHCGSCRACLDVCPTQAIIAPWRLDARKCISYLTIELREAIPVEFRKPMGNRIYGCDDCQLICPWNKFSKLSGEADFRVRHGLDKPSLIRLFRWSEAEFLSYTEGSAIRRIGYQRWLRNIAVALGNMKFDVQISIELSRRRESCTPMVREHIDWSLQEQEKKASQ